MHQPWNIKKKNLHKKCAKNIASKMLKSALVSIHAKKVTKHATECDMKQQSATDSICLEVNLITQQNFSCKIMPLLLNSSVFA